MVGRSSPRPAPGGPGPSRLTLVARLAALLVLLITVGTPGTARGAPDPGTDRPAVAVRAAAHPTFGRLVLEWSSPVEAVARVDGDRYRVRFARALEPALDGELKAASRRLGTYVQGIERGTDARELVIRLVPRTTATLTVFEQRIATIDMAPARPALPGTSAGVELRTGIHDDFARVVFDWGRAVPFRSTQAGDQVVVEFDGVARIDATTLRERLRSRATEVDTSVAGDQTRVRFTLEPGVSARVFPVEDRLVVVDLDDPGPADPDRSADDVAEPEPGPQRPSPTGSAPTAPPRPETATIGSAGSDVSGTPPAAAQAAAQQSTGTGSGPLPAVATDRHPADGARDPAVASPTTSTSNAPLPKRDPSRARVPFLQLQIASGAQAGGVYLDFAWSRSVAAAMFVRAGQVWTVFAARSTNADGPTLPKLSPAVQGFVGPGDLVAADGGTAIRFPLRRPLVVGIEQRGNLWRLNLRSVGSAAGPELLLTPRRLTDPARLRLKANQPVRLVTFIDPEVRDRLEVWPLAASIGQQHQRLVDVELLATAQGLAWSARSDRLETRFGDGTVELMAADGLWLSTDVGVAGGIAPAGPDDRPAPPSVPAIPRVPDGSVPAQASGSAAALGGPPLGLAAFELRHDETMARRRIGLMYDVVEEPAADRNRARLDLARFFLGQARAAEALAVLGVMDEPGDPGVRLARQGLAGAADLLMGRLADAEAGLGAPELDADPEVALWRAALAAARADWPTAARELARSESTLADYPRRLQHRLGLPAAQIAIETGDPARADQVLDRLERQPWDPVVRARIGFVRGLAEARAGNTEAADRTWRQVERDGDPVTQVKAVYARMHLLLDADLIGPHAVLAELTPLRRLWRGHPWEFTMLDGLARVQARAQDIASAIRTWRDALVRFAEAAEAPAIARTMRDTFVDALLGESGHHLDPVRAYALYQDFIDLVPDDERGDRVRERLAGQLAGLDLIHPAAELLEQLIDGRLTGAAKADAGARLAELWLREPAPAAALAALDRSEVEGPLAPMLAERRLGVRARALARLGETGPALALLADRDSPEVRAIRAEILWQTRDWPALIATLEPMLTDAGAAAELSAVDRARVVQLAVAHAQTGQHRALARLRTRFGPMMRDRPAEPAFLMATLTPGAPVAPEAVLAVADDHLPAGRRLPRGAGARVDAHRRAAVPAGGPQDER